MKRQIPKLDDKELAVAHAIRDLKLDYDMTGNFYSAYIAAEMLYSRKDRDKDPCFYIEDFYKEAGMSDEQIYFYFGDDIAETLADELLDIEMESLIKLNKVIDDMYA